MGCGSSAAREEPIIDIGRYIEEYAWQFFDPEFSWKDCVLPIKQNYYLEINWNYVEIRHEICRFEKRLEECERTRSPLVLFKTVFCNDTDDEQSYTFRATRTTTSSCTVTVVKGWTIGGEAGLQLSLGEVVPGSQGGGGVTPSAKITVSRQTSRTTGQRFEETLSWGVDSQVKVKGGQNTHAEMLIQEEEYVADFEIKTYITAPRPRGIPVAVRRKKTKELVEVIDIPAHNFLDIFGGRRDIEVQVTSLETMSNAQPDQDGKVSESGEPGRSRSPTPRVEKEAEKKVPEVSPLLDGGEGGDGSDCSGSRESSPADSEPVSPENIEVDSLPAKQAAIDTIPKTYTLICKTEGVVCSVSGKEQFIKLFSCDPDGEQLPHSHRDAPYPAERY